MSIQFLFGVMMVCSTQGAAPDAVGEQRSMSVNPKATMRKEAAALKAVTQHQHLQQEFVLDNRTYKAHVQFNDSTTTCSHAVPTLSTGTVIRLKNPQHGAYLGMCGNYVSCGSGNDQSSYNVYAYMYSTDNRLKWTVELEDMGGQPYIYLKNHHNAYLGMGCTPATACSGSAYTVYGWKNKNSRSRFKMVVSNNCMYLKQVDHSNHNVGVCGGATSCASSKYGIFGFPTQHARTRWEVTTVSR